MIAKASAIDAMVAPLAEVEAADSIVSCLEKAGVEYVFGVPGGAVEPIYNALARSARRGGPRAVVARHEAGAAFMADGYARETGRLGVCISHIGARRDQSHHRRRLRLQQSGPAPGNHRSTRSAVFRPWGAAGIGLHRRECRGHVRPLHALQLPRFARGSGRDQGDQRDPSCAAHSLSGPAHLSFPVDILRSRFLAEEPRDTTSPRWCATTLALIDERSIAASECGARRLRRASCFSSAMDRPKRSTRS